MGHYKEFIQISYRFKRGIILFGDISKETVIGLWNIIFNESYDIFNIYLIKEFNYNLLSMIHLVAQILRYDIVKKTDCVIEDSSENTLLFKSR